MSSVWFIVGSLLMFCCVSHVHSTHVIIDCARRLDVHCMLDQSEDILHAKSQRFLIEADASAIHGIAARQAGDNHEKPSELIRSISNIVQEVTAMFFQNGFAGFFRDGKDDESENDEENEDIHDVDNKENQTESKTRSLRKDGSEARGKKKKQKKQKLKTLIKLLILGAVLFVKLTLLLKILSAHLQLKFLAIAAAGLLINAARFYIDLKKGHHPQKVIYYEHAQHQHHYENDDDWGGSSHGGGYWGRSYDDEEKEAAADTAQHLAYRKHKPQSDSWF